MQKGSKRLIGDLNTVRQLPKGINPDARGLTAREH
jgi:hypothetical protein